MLYKDFPIHIVKQKKTKLVCGIGINDAYYQVSVKLDDVVLKCPIYTRWITMLQRCYDEKFIKNIHHMLDVLLMSVGIHSWHFVSGCWLSLSGRGYS